MGYFAWFKENLSILKGQHTVKDNNGGDVLQSSQQFSQRAILLGVLGLVLFLGSTLYKQQQKNPTFEMFRPEPITDPGLTEIIPGEMTNLQRYQDILSVQLENILSQVKGAGKVSVYVNLASGPEYTYAHNQSIDSRTTEERDTSGGERRVNEVREDNQLVTVSAPQSGTNRVLIQREFHPLVQGVLIVAPGAENSQVKVELIRAAQVALGIGSHQVVVLAGER